MTLLRSSLVASSALLLLSTYFSTSAFATPVKFTRRQGQAQSYPPTFAIPTADQTPQPWMDELARVTALGKIPNFPPSVVNPDGTQSYPNPAMNTDPNVCSWTTMKCDGPNDIVTPPQGEISIAFDDGPTQDGSPVLLNFVTKQNLSATHFMIGSNIVANNQWFQAYNNLGTQHFAVHTWSHHEMTTLTNQQIVAELGWTMQIIYDQTGRMPAFWRAPQGDIDNRVRAIAENVFGLVAVQWASDCNDWCIQTDGSSACPGSQPGQTQQSVLNAITNVFNTHHPTDPKGISILEHELTTFSVNAFESITWQRIQSDGWTPRNIAQFGNGTDWYQNAVNAVDTPTKPASVMQKDQIAPGSTSSGSSSASAAVSGSSSAPPSSATKSGTAASTSSAITAPSISAEESKTLPTGSVKSTSNSAFPSNSSPTLFSSLAVGTSMILFISTLL